MKEHQRAVWNGDINALALAEHAWKEHHNMDWHNAKVLEANKGYWHIRCSFELWHIRCSLELWHINKEANPMNRERGPLPEIYRSLFTNLSDRE